MWQNNSMDTITEGNTIEAGYLDTMIADVLRAFPYHSRRAVEAFLLRGVYGRKYGWIATRVGAPSPQTAFRMAQEGRVLLDVAIDAGKLDRDQLGERFAAVVPRR